ncbi:MAG: hypothetical protein FVQ84_09160 [Planctomycetes bacterium]|nr:hypothetical protein [Planctomycetota bacterium]
MCVLTSCRRRFRPSLPSVCPCFARALPSVCPCLTVPVGCSMLAVLMLPALSCYPSRSYCCYPDAILARRSSVYGDAVRSCRLSCCFVPAIPARYGIYLFFTL